MNLKRWRIPAREYWNFYMLVVLSGLSLSVFHIPTGRNIYIKITTIPPFLPPSLPPFLSATTTVEHNVADQTDPNPTRNYTKYGCPNLVQFPGDHCAACQRRCSLTSPLPPPPLPQRLLIIPPLTLTFFNAC